MTPEEFVTEYRMAKASAILRTNDQGLARDAMSAAVRGGFRVIEFTMSIPKVATLIDEFARREGLIVGAGTVLTTDEVHEVVDSGARFVVSPVVDMEVIAACKQRNVACMPGCTTPTEMLTAHRAGAQLQKLFPEAGTGPLWIKHCLGPLPFLKIVPTTGVTPENVADYFRAGAYAVGFVASLFTIDDMASRNLQAMEQRASEIMQQLETIRV